MINYYKIKKAFTLIELILVIVIMWILLWLLNHASYSVWYKDGTYYYLEQTFWNLFNVNNYNYDWEFPDFWELVLSPSKNIELDTYYKDSSESSGYKKIKRNHGSSIIDTIWLNWTKINRGESIIYKVDFLTDNLTDRYKIYKVDYNGNRTEIDDIYKKVCIENFNKRRYCINKNFHMWQMILKSK